MSPGFWSALGRVADVVQLLSAAFPLAVGVYFLWRSRKLNQRLQLLATQVSKRPVAFAIGFGGSIEGSVRQYLKDTGVDIEVISCSRKEMVQPKDFPSILKEIHDHKIRLDEVGVTEVHLFYKGPVTFATALGAMLRNWVPAKVYAFEAGTYKLHMVLDKETVIAPK